MLTRPTTQAGHAAALHPRLRAVLERAMERAYSRLGVRVTFYSTRRPQRDCSKISGPCSADSLHSVSPTRAADLGGWPKADTANWARFAGIVREVAAEIGEPCVEWAGASDANHFELDCPGPGTALTLPVVPPGLLAAGRALDPGNLTPDNPDLGRAVAVAAVAVAALYLLG